MLRLSALRTKIRRYSILPVFALALAALSARSASADLVVTAGSVTVAPGSTGDSIEVTVKNTGSTGVNIGGFAFGLDVSNSNLTFTDVTTSTTTAPYIFDSHSLFGPSIIITPPPPPLAVDASDNYSTANSGITLAAGATAGLGHVVFNVAPGAANAVVPVVLDSFATSFADFGGSPVTVPIDLTNGSITIGTAVPEPASVVLLGLGVFGIRGARVFRRRLLNV
jgi:hypothetical protein